MVELPLDDAATRYQEVAQALENIRWTMDVSDLKGQAAETLSATIESFNQFTAKASDVLAEHVGTVREQHSADEDLRDNPKPAEVRELEAQAARLKEAAARSSGLSTAPMLMAQAAEAKAEDARQRRDAAFARHTGSASQNAPRLLVTPPDLTGAGGGFCTPNIGFRGYESGGGTAGSQQGSGSGGAGGDGAGGGSSSLPSAGSSGGGLGGDSLSASDVGTETSADALAPAAGSAQSPMMGLPAAGQAQQPQMPSMSGTGAAGVPQGGMLGATPGASGAAGARNRKDRKDVPTDLSGAGVVAGGVAGAVGAAGAGAVDRGVSVQGVTTKADTSGVGTNLSSANGKPPAGGNPTGNMMRGGMIGPMMGGMGSGASAGGNSKERPDIKPLIKDKEMHGLDSLNDAINGGIIGRDTAEAPDETGIDRFLDPDKIKKD